MAPSPYARTVPAGAAVGGLTSPGVGTAGPHRPARRRSAVGVALGLWLLSAGAASAAPAPVGITVTPAQASDTWNPALLRQAGLDPERLHCNPRVSWVPDLRHQAGEAGDQILAALPAGSAPANAAERQRLRDAIADLVFWRLVRVTIVDGENHNAGVLPLRGFQWRDANGISHPVLVFRSAITRIEPGDPSCVGSLLQDGGVRHVVNLYDADRIPVGPLLQREEQLSRSCQASYLPPREANARYGSWRENLRRHPPESPGYSAAMAALARLIREQILAPGGSPPQGNIYLHCGGGMHRSGMVMGILDRCVNGTAMEQVTRLYLHHTGWQSSRQPGGAEQGNLDVIAGFDCRSLGPLPGTTTAAAAGATAH